MRTFMAVEWRRPQNEQGICYCCSWANTREKSSIQQVATDLPHVVCSRARSGDYHSSRSGESRETETVIKCSQAAQEIRTTANAGHRSERPVGLDDCNKVIMFQPPPPSPSIASRVFVYSNNNTSPSSYFSSLHLAAVDDGRW